MVGNDWRGESRWAIKDWPQGKQGTKIIYHHKGYKWQTQHPVYHDWLYEVLRSRTGLGSPQAFLHPKQKSTVETNYTKDPPRYKDKRQTGPNSHMVPNFSSYPTENSEIQISVFNEEIPGSDNNSSQLDLLEISNQDLQDISNRQLRNGVDSSCCRHHMRTRNN